MSSTRYDKSRNTRRSNRFSMVALALSLSAGTVVGLFGIASMAPAMAQAGNGGGGNGGNGGGESGSPMAAGRIFAVNQQPNNQRPPRFTRATFPKPCGGAADSIDTQSCRYTLR